MTQEQQIEYAKWILSESSQPIDEIQYLIEYALQSENRQTIINAALAVLKHRRQND
jgi:hypothetical protein